MTGPLQISPETALKLSKELHVPLEHLMHMPKHILLQKLAELAAKEDKPAKSDAGDGGGEKPGDQAP
ncbi:YycC family protein [Paenibacillus humicola]|uniref:YycC family protein n=1 Tax=Paenibacillus humicola TaxID=3110540 RepID=UPI00237BCC89|nr:YycC family protein [Paenibacillus humicola]